MPARLPDRKILVTGAAAGIGRACAEAALREGAAVALADQDRRRLEETASALTTLGALSAVEMDVAAQGAVAAGVGRAAEALGGLDGVVNCAGIDLHQPFEATDWAAWRRLMAVNLDGAMHVCQAALEPLKASGGGAISATRRCAAAPMCAHGYEGERRSVSTGTTSPRATCRYMGSRTPRARGESRSTM